jgi:ABC-2 type transport system permease protein
MSRQASSQGQGLGLGWLRALPTLLRVGAAETLAYRAEFVIWMLTTTLPLVMLGLWTSVASEGPFAHYQQEDFIAYYLAALIVRNLTGTWVLWQINEDIRQGTLSLRLLRPIHPFVTYAATHLSAVPLRALIAVPVAVILLLSSARQTLALDPASLAMLAVSLPGAWCLVFFALVLIGTLGLFMERSLALFNVYMGVFAVLSGYLVPLDLLPGWAQGVAAWAPFRFMLSLPIEILMGAHDTSTALMLLAVQWGYAALVIGLALAVWQAGIRRYEAYGA